MSTRAWAPASGWPAVDEGGFDAWKMTMHSRVETALDHALPRVAPGELATLVEGMRYVVMGSGKRIRPLLCYAAGLLGRASPAEVDAAACAVEIIHCYSLVHDDLPCMDDDDLRRGRPTCHKKYGEALALLVGDSLHDLAFEVLLQSPQAAPATLLLAESAGWRGMAGGQALDLASQGARLQHHQLEDMHRRKTGALIRASLLLGLHCGPDAARDHEVIAQYGDKVGVLYQVVDDILDASATTEQLGKTAGKDSAHDKSTYVTVLGLSRAQTLADELTAQAQALLAPLGEIAEPLRRLTAHIAHRHG